MNHKVGTNEHHDILIADGVPVYAWRHGVTFEEAAISQLLNLAKMPFVFHHVAAMPDTHFGIGATVGSVFASRGAVIPAAVGVDIGCGMIAAPTTLHKSDFDNLEVRKTVRAAIERRIPMGRTANGGQGDRGAWGEPPIHIVEAWTDQLLVEFSSIIETTPSLIRSNSLRHLGTLGTGNHFIEIQHDTNDLIWIMLHSGSRGIGNRIGQTYIDIAKDLCSRWFVTLPDRDLAYLPDDEPACHHYKKALAWAQKFAYVNRQLMLKAVIEALVEVFPSMTVGPEINTHHNYAAMESHYGTNVLLTRKGAIRARANDLGIIPGSMGTRSYIVRGLGNPSSFHSCSHGAGRAMSRTEAKRRYTVDDHTKATEGVECRKDSDVIDETPMAYKDIDAVISAESDLVEVVHTLKQLICCKG